MDDQEMIRGCPNDCSFRDENGQCPYHMCLNARFNNKITMGQWIDYDKLMKKKDD